MVYKLNDEQETLKGGISYYTYIWRTEPGACATCQALDGTKYSSTDEIPDRPHPNCKCYMDVEENKSGETEDNNYDKSSKDSDRYDDIAVERDYTNLKNLINETIGNVESIKDEIKEIINKLNNEIIKEEVLSAKREIENIIFQLNTQDFELSDILSKLMDLINFKMYEMEEKEVITLVASIKVTIISIKIIVGKLSERSNKAVEEAKREWDKNKNNSLEDWVTIIKKKGIEALSEDKISELVGRNYNLIMYGLGKTIIGKNAAGMLDLAHPKMNNPNYVKDTIKLNNYNDKWISKYQEYLRNKIEEQFKSYDNINPEEVDGYYFKSNSNPSQELAQTKVIKEFIKQNKQDIIDGILFKDKQTISVVFPTGDWYYSIDRADIIDCYFDNNDDLHIILADTYDFNGGESKLIEAAKKAMQRGELNGKFIIWDILIEKNDFDKI